MPRNNKSKLIFIFLYAYDNQNYDLIFRDTLVYSSLPIEIGFAIAEKVCFITHKKDELNWSITGYTYVNNEFRIFDYFETDVLEIKSSKIGYEKYINYHKYKAFEGYYSSSDLTQYFKTNFTLYPAYELRRNIYSPLDGKVIFKSDDNEEILHKKIAEIFFRINQDDLIASVLLNNNLLTRDNSLVFSINFDRKPVRLLNLNKNKPVLRDKIDDDISGFSFMINSKKEISIINSFIGNRYNSDFKEKIKLSYFENHKNDLVINLTIPFKFYNLIEKIDSLGVFSRLESQGKDQLNDRINLFSDSDGDIQNPSTYSIISFNEKEQFWKLYSNKKFFSLIEKIKRNGLFF